MSINKFRRGSCEATIYAVRPLQYLAEVRRHTYRHGDLTRKLEHPTTLDVANAWVNDTIRELEAIE